VFEERQVLVAVGVEEALAEIHATLRCQAARGLELALAVAQRRLDRAGEATVANLELGAEHVFAAEIVGEGLDLVARGRGHYGHGVPAPPVSADDGPRLGVDLGRESLRVEALGDFHHRGLGLALEQPRRLGHESREAQLPELEAQPGHRREREARRSDAAAQQAVEDQRDDRESGDQRAIEVEECADPRPGRTVLDVPRDVVVPGHGAGSIASRTPRGQPMAYHGGPHSA